MKEKERKRKKKREPSQVHQFSIISTSSERGKKFDFKGHTKKILRLLAEKKLRYTPRIRFSMSHELSEFKPRSCEKDDLDPGELPAIRFIPEEPASRAFVNFTVYDPATTKKSVTSRSNSSTDKAQRRT